MSEIRFENFSCGYRSKKKYIPALEDLTFCIADGEFFVVAGESGCGKTTLLNCVLGLCEYTAGSLSVDGIAADRALAGSIGYVRQEPGLYPHLTVYENIAFPLRTIHTAQKEVDARVKALAERLGLSLLLTRVPRQLSAGQQQTAAIARALIKKPTLLLFDEPFSNLDPNLHSRFRRLVRNLHEEYRMTVLFVTHDLGEAFSLADRMLILQNGRIADLGTPRELLADCRSELLKGYLHETNRFT